ncbi:MAG: hypothetical protein ACK5O7_03885 [Holosporales bacterium]
MAFTIFLRHIGLSILLTLSSVYASEFLVGLDEDETVPLPHDVIKHVMGMTEAPLFARMGMMNKSLNKFLKAEKERAVSSSTFNESGCNAKDHLLLTALQPDEIERPLRTLMERDGGVAVASNSVLHGTLSAVYGLANIRDWIDCKDLASPLYQTAFGKDLPQAQQELALQQLMALVGTPVYLQGQDAAGLQRFLSKHGHKLHSLLESKKQLRPLVNFLHGDVDEKILAAKPHTFVMSDVELAQQPIQGQLEHYLAIQAEHHVYLSLGVGPFVEYGKLTLQKQYMPTNLRHLTIMDPTCAVRITAQCCLSGTNLHSLHLHLPQLFTAEDHFVANNPALQSVTLDLPNLIAVERQFASNNPALQTVILAMPKLKNIGDGILGGCKSLSQREKNKIRNYFASLGLEWQENVEIAAIAQ